MRRVPWGSGLHSLSAFPVLVKPQRKIWKRIILTARGPVSDEFELAAHDSDRDTPED